MSSTPVSPSSPYRTPLRNWISGCVLYSLALGLMTVSPFWHTLLTRATFGYRVTDTPIHQLITQFLDLFGRDSLRGALSVLVLSQIYSLVDKLSNPAAHQKIGRPAQLFECIGRVLAHHRQHFAQRKPGFPGFPEFTHEEITTMKYFVVKFFFLPQMWLGLYDNLGRSLTGFSLIGPDGIGTLEGLRHGYIGVLDLLFLVDVAIFTLGYSCEFSKTKIRSVEPSIFGWMVALVCYYPFRPIAENFLAFNAPDTPDFFHNYGITAFFYGIGLLMYGVYVWASLALGMRGSNLTNRGTVTYGPYRWIRHPAYATKTTVWVIMAIPEILNGNIAAIVTSVFWFTIYYLRALTEERHLLADPEYVAYCEKVKFRYVPGVF